MRELVIPILGRVPLCLNKSTGVKESVFTVSACCCCPEMENYKARGPGELLIASSGINQLTGITYLTDSFHT